MFANDQLQNREGTGYTHHGPVLMSARRVAALVGANYYSILHRIAAGGLRPDAMTDAGGFLFREDRLNEIEATFA